jgi:hypothetical protein
MSFMRNHGIISFECDDCANILETEFGDFSTALEYAKKAGWKPMKAGNGWEHQCPVCNKVQQ